MTPSCHSVNISVDPSLHALNTLISHCMCVLVAQTVTELDEVCTAISMLIWVKRQVFRESLIFFSQIFKKKVFHFLNESFNQLCRCLHHSCF